MLGIREVSCLRESELLSLSRTGSGRGAFSNLPKGGNHLRGKRQDRYEQRLSH